MSFDILSAFYTRGIADTLFFLALGTFFIFFFFLIAKNIKQVRKPFIVFSMIIQLSYILWRVLFTIPFGNTAGLVFAILLILAEMLGAFQAITHRLLYMREPKQFPSKLPYTEDLPTVDVLVCTYNEPVKVVEKTIAAAVSLSYPRDKLKVYVCDDGRRDELRKLSEKYGAAWVTRPDNKHAKAGNINNCLRTVAKGEFFLILDADVVARTALLERTMGYFVDKKVAFVQAPQVFYTPDPFQYNLFFKDRIPNEQDYFMREIQPRRAAYNATLFVGSNGVFRRSCIDEIGLIPTKSITEDIATSLVLEQYGYTGVTVDEVLAVGLSAESFADYVSQHERWGRGNIQVMKKHKLLTMKGLTFMQRLLYFDGILYWFFGLQKMIYIACPIFFLLTGIPIFYSDFATMLLMFLPTFLLSVLIFRLFSYKNRNLGWAHIYEVALAPYLALSAFVELLFSYRFKFKVTPKGNSRNRTFFSFKVAVPHIVLTICSFVALGIGLQKMTGDSVYMIPVYVLNISWLLYNLWSLLLNILICFEKPRLRSSERLKVNAILVVKAQSGVLYTAKVIDISETGCGLYVERKPEAVFKSNQNVTLYLSSEAEPISGLIARQSSANGFIGIKFNDLNANQYIQLVKFIFDRQVSGYGSFKRKEKRKVQSDIPSTGIPAYEISI